MSMTALQDWLSFRPVDQSAIKEMVCRPLRAVLSTPDAAEPTELKVLQPGIERC
jgi:oligoribonuclease (3'-5' exoribonuclease)